MPDPRPTARSPEQGCSSRAGKKVGGGKARASGPGSWAADAAPREERSAREALAAGGHARTAVEAGAGGRRGVAGGWEGRRGGWRRADDSAAGAPGRCPRRGRRCRARASGHPHPRRHGRTAASALPGGHAVGAGGCRAEAGQPRPRRAAPGAGAPREGRVREVAAARG
jgi:hypothetical protein